MQNKTLNAYQWVPSVYLMQGLPFALVTMMSSVIYKNFNFSNSKIAFYTSLFTLPWILKFFLAPALENIASKKKMTLLMQFSIACLTLLLALSFFLTNLNFWNLNFWFYLSCIIFMLIALAASIHDINSDGIYLELLDYHAQARFIGIRTVFYHIGKLLCQGGVIFVAGILIETIGKEKTWPLILLFLTLILLLVALYNKIKIPQENISINKTAVNTLNSYKNVITEFRKLPHIIAMLIFIFLYNFPNMQIMKIFPLFMLDKIAQGGLGLSVDQVGVLYGSVGVVAMLAGVTLSGFLLARLTLKKCLVPFTMVTVLANVSYLLLVFYPTHRIEQTIFCITLGEFGFGLSNGAYMFYLVTLFSHKAYSMSLYAMGTAVMLLGFMVSGGMSGWLQSWIGYSGFFMWIVLSGLGIIGMAIYNVKKVL